jgi:hypothetical protein
LMFVLRFAGPCRRKTSLTPKCAVELSFGRSLRPA